MDEKDVAMEFAAAVTCIGCLVALWSIVAILAPN